jgi:hypothetical protein
MENQIDPANSADNAKGPMLRVSSAEFRSKFNRQTFQFGHLLSETNLFSIDRLFELAQRILSKSATDRFAAVNYRQANVGTKIGTMPNLELLKTISKLDQIGSWVKLSHIQDFDLDYATVLDVLIAECEGLLDQPIRKNITWSTMTVFIASPKIPTPFHIDHESNFLFQIRGDKEVCLFDPDDRELVTDKEVEEFYLGNPGAAVYKEHLQSRGTVYRLTPDAAVHLPPLTPHWVKNGDNISVSVSISFSLRSLDKVARIYQANSFLRTCGLKPTPPGTSPAKDRIKATLVSCFKSRSPSTYYDLMFRPANRLHKPINFAKRMIGQVSGRARDKTN